MVTCAVRALASRATAGFAQGRTPLCSESVEVGPREHGRGWAACIGKLRDAIAERLQLEARARGAFALQVRDETVFPHYDLTKQRYWLQAEVVSHELRPASAS